jgi:hypothetical protein
MKRKRHTEEQIIAILKEHEAGMNIADLCRGGGCGGTSIRTIHVSDKAGTLQYVPTDKSPRQRR